MNKHLKRSTFLLLNLFLFLGFLPDFVHAQAPKYVEIDGKVRKDNRPIGGVIIKISQTITSKDNGSFGFILDFQKKYTISFGKEGLVSKMVEFSTVIPADLTDIIYSPEFAIDLFDDIAGVSQSSAMNKAVAKFSYNPTYEDFVFDANYSKQIQSEQNVARKEAEELRRLQ